MSVLVVYASKHGATREIAERIAEKLTAAGQRAEAHPVEQVNDLTGYDAFVIGSAAYLGHWMKEATRFVRDNHDTLARRPVWLFSSGPLGTKATDASGRDLHEAAVPEEIAELRDAVDARDHQVFFGALRPRELGFAQRALRKLPAGRELLPEGDFRDWAEIEAWAAAIAGELAGSPAAEEEGGQP